MKCVLRRETSLKTVMRRAKIGKEDESREIFLGFLKHIRDTENASPETINSEMLGRNKNDPCGKNLAEMLIRNGLALFNSQRTLSLTSMGNTAIETRKLMEANVSDCLFTLVIDSVLPHCFYDYKEISISKKNKLDPIENSCKLSKIFTTDKYPIRSGRNDNNYNEAKQYHLPGRNNELFSLYSIDDYGEDLQDANKTGDIEVTLINGEIPSVSLKVKDTESEIINSPMKKYSLSKLYDTISENSLFRLYDVRKTDDGFTVAKKFSTLNKDESDSGLCRISLRSVPVDDFGIFDTLEISDVKIIVDNPEDIYSWALTRLLKAVDTYVSKDDYNKYRRQAAEWCAPHVDEDDAIDTDQIYQNLPEYETLLHYFIHKDRMDGRYESVIEKTMKDNKNLRWYFITPGMLTFNYGGRIV